MRASQEGVPKAPVEQIIRKRRQVQLGKLRINFLEHELTQGEVMVDDIKIKAIFEWEKPKTTKGLRSFLGLASYYRKSV